MPLTNCFRIEGGSVLWGIPVRSALPLEDPFLPFVGDEVEKAPDHFVVTARFDSNTSAVVPIDPGSGEVPNYCFVYFEVPRLDFGSSRLTEGLNLRPGGEWWDRNALWREAPKPLRQELLRREPNRAELWMLSPCFDKTREQEAREDKLVVVDVGSGLRQVHWRRGELALESLGVIELARYLSERGRKMIHKRGVEWAYHNLEKLAKNNPNSNLKQFLGPVRYRLQEVR